MSIERVFELIRKEQVVFWIGSGFSKYAGYPLAQELSDKIYSSLSLNEQKEINQSLSLADLSEEFVRTKMGSRNELNGILKSAFLKSPISIQWHNIISKISHVKTIITTNYDNLFEIAFGKDCIKLINEIDIAKIDKQIEIFKVHGDLSEPETIIISKSDYTKFFYDNRNTNLYWNVIAERISNKAVVFIGYSFEDPNIFNIVEKVKQALKGSRKDVFLIAPRFSNSKITYLAQNGIQYIDLKGEIFIEKLYKNIKENIISDFEKGFVGPETLRKFFLKNGLLVELQALEERFKLKSISGLDGVFKGLLSLELKNNTEVFKKFSDFVSGKQFGELEIDGKNMEGFGFSASEINLVTGNKNDFKLTFISKPVHEGVVDVVFENDCEMNNISYTMYSSKELIKIVTAYKNIELSCALKRNSDEPNQVNFSYVQKRNFQKTNDAINGLKILKYLCEGIGFRIYLKNIVDKSFKFQFSRQDKFLEEIEENLDYYELLKKVEYAYKIQFENISEATNEYYNRMVLAMNAAENKDNFVEWDEELQFDIDKPGSSLELLLKMQDMENTFRAENTEAEKIEIHGQIVNIGFKMVEFCKPYITNLKNVVEDGEKMAKVRSRTKQVKINYSKISLSGKAIN
jgi:hypothetical protein